MRCMQCMGERRGGGRELSIDRLRVVCVYVRVPARHEGFLVLFLFIQVYQPKKIKKLGSYDMMGDGGA